MAKNVRMPDGTIVRNVPDDITQKELQRRYERRQQPETETGGESRSTNEWMRGGAETAMTMGSGAIAEPVSGIMGIGQGLVSAVRGDDDVLGSMVERIEGTQEALTYEPKTEAGQEVTRTVAKPFQWYTRQMEEAGRNVTDATGSPVAGTVVSTAGQAAPMAVGARGTRSALQRRGDDVREATEAARREGVDIRSRGREQAEQIAGAGERRAAPARGEGMPEIQQAVRQAREASKQQVDQLYERARRTRAGLPVEQAREFIPMARRSLADFDTDMMPNVQRRMRELEEMADLPEGSQVKLNAIEQWRTRLNKNRPAKSDTAQNAALDILRGQADRFLESKFNADMISGDPTAIGKWREARGAFRQMKETFDSDRAIRDLAKQDATPEEMRRWVFGASLTGAKKQAGDTVSRIKSIVGEESPQFRAMRDDAALDLMEPLMRDTPNLKGFVSNYDKFIRNNRTVAEELFTPEQLKEMKQIRDFASANVKRGEKPPQIPLARMGSVFALGHGIARAGAKVRIGQAIGQGLINKSNKRAFLGEVLGYDPGAPLIPKTPAVTGATIQSGQRAGEESAPREDEQGRAAGQ